VQIPRLLTRFEDHFYAFDKPAGMAVHANAEKLPDLVSWLKGQKSLPRDVKPGHRLDRGTSGVVLCGAGGKARARIAQWLDDASAEKHYLALVAGKPKQEEGFFEGALFDRRRKKNLPARTQFRVREHFGGFCLLELQLHTGRKHQIRRHLANAELPVVGDDRHGPKRPQRVPNFPNRLWLHAWKLNLGGRCIEAPLPQDLVEHLEGLRESASEGSSAPTSKSPKENS
jgi:23S rRNA-/tRNA-specific pseudouridylate synthase